MPAIDAGKYVFVEWALGVSLKEAREIAEAAEKKGVRTMVGLQAKQSPTIQKVSFGFGRNHRSMRQIEISRSRSSQIPEELVEFSLQRW